MSFYKGITNKSEEDFYFNYEMMRLILQNISTCSDESTLEGIKLLAGKTIDELRVF